MKCSNCFKRVPKFFSDCPYCFMPMKQEEKIKIKQLSIIGLFNKMDCEYEFNDDITIIIAPNGCGKTTTLNFVNFMANPNFENYEKIKDVPFTKVVCTFSDGSIRTLARIKESDAKKKLDATICEKFDNFNTKINEYLRDNLKACGDDGIVLLKDLIDSDYIIDGSNRYKLSDFLFEFTVEKNGTVKKENFVDRLNKLENLKIKNISSSLDVCKRFVFSALSTYCLGLRFINTKKSFLPDSPDRIKELYKASLKKELKDCSMSKFIELTSDKLFMTFFKLDLIEMYRLFKKAPSFADFKWLDSNVLLFKMLFNERNELTNKSIDFSDNKGFVITENGKVIPANNLSSGEKNLFAIYYSLIFKDEPIVLMDEPEISLHIDWQENLIQDIKRINENNHCQIIIATHSPNLISYHTDLISKREIKFYD